MLDMVKETAEGLDKVNKMVGTAITAITEALFKAESKQTAYIKKIYQERIGAAKAQADEEISVYSSRIKEIDNELKMIGRKDADAEYAAKMNRLNAALGFEKDEFNRFEIEKEIAKITAENDKRKYREALVDEKEALNEMIAWTKNMYQVQKDFYKEMMNAQMDALREAIDGTMSKTAFDYHYSGVGYEFLGDRYWEIVNAISEIASSGNFAGTGGVSVYQNINSQAMTPAELARETQLALVNALKYGR